MISRNGPLALVIVLTGFALFRGAAVDAQTVIKGPGPTEWVGDLAPISSEDWSCDRAAHLLERAGFGGTPEEVQRLASLTPAEAVDYLVHYERRDNDHLRPFEESGIYGHYGPLRAEPKRTEVVSSGTTTLAGRVEVADGGVGGVPLRDHEIYLDIPGQEQRVELSDHYGRFRFHSVPLGNVAVHARGKHHGKTQNTSNIQHVTLTKADNVTVLILTEFGRRVKENGRPNNGTDHGMAGPWFVVGNHVKGGIYFDYPSLTDLDQGDLKMRVDFRSVYTTMLKEWLGYGGDFQPILDGDFPTIPILV